MAYQVPPLRVAYDGLQPYIDAETMQLHHDKHHESYVDHVNKAVEPYRTWPISRSRTCRVVSTRCWRRSGRPFSITATATPISSSCGRSSDRRQAARCERDEGLLPQLSPALGKRVIRPTRELSRGPDDLLRRDYLLRDSSRQRRIRPGAQGGLVPGWGLDQRPIGGVLTGLLASYARMQSAWTAAHPIAFRRRPTCVHGPDLGQMVLRLHGLSTPTRHFEVERDMGPGDSRGDTRDSTCRGPWWWRPGSGSFSSRPSM